MNCMYEERMRNDTKMPYVPTSWKYVQTEKVMSRHTLNQILKIPKIVFMCQPIRNISRHMRSIKLKT